MSDRIEALQQEIETEQARYIALRENDAKVSLVDKSSARLKSLKAQLVEAITEGAGPCRACGLLPMGIHQPRGFEIGCSTCATSTPDAIKRGDDAAWVDYCEKNPSFRAVHVQRLKAIDAWNKGFFAARRRDPR